MIPPEVLTRKSLFSLLYKIDQDLSEQTRIKGCPIAGGRFTVRIISASLAAALLESLASGDTVLVKGSHSSQMEQVVEALLEADT